MDEPTEVATVVHHLPSRPVRSRGVPLIEAVVLVGSASLLTLPAVVITNAAMPAVGLAIGVLVVTSLLVASRRAAVGLDWVAVRRFGRWTVLPAAELTLMTVQPADHGDRLLLHHASGTSIGFRRAEVAGLLPALGPVLGSSAAHEVSLSSWPSGSCPVIHPG
jgi:hypothetical protein